MPCMRHVSATALKSCARHATSHGVFGKCTCAIPTDTSFALVRGSNKRGRHACRSVVLTYPLAARIVVITPAVEGAVPPRCAATWSGGSTWCGVLSVVLATK
jgi:hypothetical protein